MKFVQSVLYSAIISGCAIFHCTTAYVHADDLISTITDDIIGNNNPLPRSSNDTHRDDYDGNSILGPADPMHGVNETLRNSYTRASGPGRVVGSCLQEGSVAEAKQILPDATVNRALILMGGQANRIATMVPAGDPVAQCFNTANQEARLYDANIRSPRPGIWPLP